MNIANIFKKKQKGDTITLAIDGMHCTSCSLTIDMELEDMEGVIESITSYAQSETKIVFDSKKVSEKQLRQKIEEVGYSVKEN